MKQRLESNFFLAVLVAASAAFIWISLPYFGAVLWGVIAAIMFAPVNRAILAQFPKRQNTAAALTILFILIVAVVPSVMLAALLVQEAAAFIVQLRTGQINFARMFQQLHDAVPSWASNLMDRYGLESFNDMRGQLASSLASGVQTLAAQALLIGQSTLSFIVTIGVALYLAYFLLRDGKALYDKMSTAVPLPSNILHALADRFIAVTRATINGSLVVAIVQRLVGGVIFAFLGIKGALLWGVVMAFFSLIPSIGTGLVWVPVAVYLFASGQFWQGSVLVFCGLAIIGMVDNVLRPILVGRDTRIPDYIVLISTLGGLSLMGFNGIVIGPVIAALALSVWEIFMQERTGTPAP